MLEGVEDETVEPFEKTGVGFFAAFSAFFWDPEGIGGKGGRLCEEVSAGMELEVFLVEKPCG